MTQPPVWRPAPDIIAIMSFFSILFMVSYVLCNNIYLLSLPESVMPSPSQGTEIAAEIDRLRGEFPKTQDLYREVCVLLFFRYGITPTTNRLYQLVVRSIKTISN